MKIPYVDLKTQWKQEKKNFYHLLIEFYRLWACRWLRNKKFEKKISKLCNVKYTVALNSGTDALTLGFIFRSRPGDEVITPPNSFIASAASIIHLGAKPVFVDVKETN